MAAFIVLLYEEGADDQEPGQPTEIVGPFDSVDLANGWKRSVYPDREYDVMQLLQPY